MFPKKSITNNNGRIDKNVMKNEHFYRYTAYYRIEIFVTNSEVYYSNE